MTHFWTAVANLGTWLLEVAVDRGAREGGDKAHSLDFDPAEQKIYDRGREDGYIEALSDRVE